MLSVFHEKATRFFTVFASSTFIAVITNFVAFVSPYWIQSIPEAHSHFDKIGLWTACFNGYMRPSYFGKAYYGCYYIYFVEYDGIRSWINPVWLYAIQTLSSLGILLQSLVTFIVLCQLMHAIHRDSLTAMKFNLVGHFVTAFTLAASLVAFAVARYDSTWMPFPQLNVLSWSYAIATVSFVTTVVSFVIGFLRYMYLEALAWDGSFRLPDDRGSDSRDAKHTSSRERFIGSQQLLEEDEEPQYFAQVNGYEEERPVSRGLESSPGMNRPMYA